MTDARHSSRVLSLYPRRYRARHGPEILQMHRDAVEGASATAVRLEQLDIAAHALRVRTHTGSSHRAGRFLVVTAPYALAAAGSIAAAGLTTAVADAMRGGSPAGLDALGAAVCMTVLAAGAVACLGRWTMSRALAALSLTALIAGAQGSAWLIPLLALVAVMPAGTVPGRDDRRPAVAYAVITWLPSLCAALSDDRHFFLGAIQQLGPVMLLIAIRTAAPDARPRHILAILVAGAPWATSAAGSPIGGAIVITALTIAWGAGRLSRGRVPVAT
ncbi:hypothetical protein EDD93_4566 [Streptomyces sp. 840.1]|uniref:hypothetical protein n=1 Tax=Streptomyces sp. 840.1 TaxID=2485152 RepID=UPI000F4A52EF|nr:hypothetical protein [Streptomyces sp. 840.1]ROQ70059.1 hypothetical protein EDD93_4566 [Streptomyces sp. 840.1]